MTGKSTTDQIDFFQLPWLQKQFFAAGAGKEDVDCRINALIADLAIEHHLHVPGAFKFLEDELVHAAAGFDQRRGDNREGACFFGVTRGGENFSWNLHRASIDTAAHGAATT